MEKLLEKSNEDNDFFRTRIKLDSRKERIALAKLKRANAKLEVLTKQEEKKKLDILAEVTIHASNT